MNLDEIWEKIKSDTDEIYGMKILDAFLALTKRLDSTHFNQLTPEQKKKISADAAVGLLELALIQDASNGAAKWIDGGSRFKKLTEDIGPEVLSKLDSDQIGYILGEMIANLKSLEHASVFGNNLFKLKNTNRAYSDKKNWISLLLNSAQNKYNNNGTTELLEQLLSLLRQYELIDEYVKEDLLYFIGKNNIPMRIFEKELKEMKSHEIAEIIVHMIAVRVPGRRWSRSLEIILDKIKELKEIAADELKKIIKYPVSSGGDNIKIELKSRDMLEEFWDEIVKTIES